MYCFCFFFFFLWREGRGEGTLLQRLVWICNTGHAVVRSRGREDGLANTADIKTTARWRRGVQSFNTIPESETDEVIAALVAWRKEKWRQKVDDVPPSEVGHDLCFTGPILVLFRFQL